MTACRPIVPDGPLLMRRSRLSLALAVSLAVHGALLLRAGGSPCHVQKPSAFQRAITISFSSPARAAPAPRKARAKQPRNTRQVAKKAVPPRHQRVSRKQPKRARHIERSLPRRAMPERAAVADARPRARQVNVGGKHLPEAVRRGVLEDERQRYLARLLRHIDQFKRYPPVARRRRIEGDVRLVFVPTSAGEERGARALSGPPVLRRAALRALARARPLPLPPPGWGMEAVRFTMRFRLQ